MEKENIVKKTCKELGITQKELAERMGVAENTVGNWSRNIVEVPQYAIKMFELLKYDNSMLVIDNLFDELTCSSFEDIKTLSKHENEIVKIHPKLFAVMQALLLSAPIRK